MISFYAGRIAFQMDEPILHKFYLSIITEFYYSPKSLGINFLRQKYLVEKLSAKEISGITNCGKSTVLNHLKMAGIPIRPTGRAIRKANMAYGKQRRKRLEVNHAREQKVISMMRDFKSKGYSNEKIADVLNTMKVPTKTGKGLWHRKTVWEILKR